MEPSSLSFPSGGRELRGHAAQDDQTGVLGTTQHGGRQDYPQVPCPQEPSQPHPGTAQESRLDEVLSRLAMRLEISWGRGDVEAGKRQEAWLGQTLLLTKQETKAGDGGRGRGGKGRAGQAQSRLQTEARCSYCISQPLWGDLVSSRFLHDLGPVSPTLPTSLPSAF